MAKEEMTDDQWLLAYLKDWLAWVERGAPNREPYWRHVGLCCNSLFFHGDAANRAMKKRFKRFTSPTHPFGYENYEARMETNTQHECPKRLRWVRKTIASLEAKAGNP